MAQRVYGTRLPWSNRFSLQTRTSGSLRCVVARATLAGKTVTDQVVADFMQLGYTRDVRGPATCEGVALEHS